MTHNFGSVAVEEHHHGDTRWVAVRARGAGVVLAHRG